MFLVPCLIFLCPAAFHSRLCSFLYGVLHSVIQTPYKDGKIGINNALYQYNTNMYTCNVSFKVPPKLLLIPITNPLAKMFYNVLNRHVENL